MGAGIRVQLASVLFYALVVPCHSEPAIVKVSSLDLETMNALTAAINMDALTHDAILGAIEGSQSQVIDSADPFPITAVQSVRTLSVLDGVSLSMA